jgi:hypothetical protein
MQAVNRQPACHGVVPHDRVRATQQVARIGVQGQPAGPEPQIHLIREGEAVKAIEVVCTCGQRIRLNCVF